MNNKKTDILNQSYIGVFDSGVGGLSILKAIHAIMPDVNTIFFADQAHVPYGSRSLQEIKELSVSITDFLIKTGAEIIVVACNTASAAALRHLRQVFPDYPFVGMEPAVKPAAQLTKSGKVGVLATPATFQGDLYNSLVEKYGAGIEIYQDTCPGLVKEIEEGNLNRDSHTETILRKAIMPMIDAGIDTIVLGCTHYPFTIPLIEEIAHNRITVIDPSIAVARQTKRMFEQHNLAKQNSRNRSRIFITSGDPESFKTKLPIFIPEEYPVNQAVWNNSKISIKSDF